MKSKGRHHPERRRGYLRSVLPAVITALLPAVALAGPLTDKATQPGLAHPISDSGHCSLCHGDYAIGHYEPWPTWSTSMMAQSARDPLFWAALDVANNDVPGVGDFCLRCHAPGAWLGERSEPPGGSADGCGLLGLIDQRDNDFDGINCELCHRMMINPAPPVGEAAFYTENGQYWIDDGDCGGVGEPCRRGPYDYLGGEDPPPHAWAASVYHEDSVICGNCHNVTNPLKTLVENGIDTGIPFPIERTYKEWLQSSYSTLGPGFFTCQNCHMPDSLENPAFACLFGLTNRAGDMEIHEFVGGNAWIPEVLRQEYPALGLDQNFVATRDATIAVLQSAAAVELSIQNAATASGSLDAQVTVTNLTGHKLPTGYPEGRRMWLNVEARDGMGALIWESGAYDGATGVLTEDAQIKIYRIDHGVWNHNGTNECDIVDGSGNPMFHFVLGDCIALDNRIPPEGFTGAGDLETKPVNYTYPETAPGSGVLVNFDVTSYSIPIPPAVVMPITVTVTLSYQTSSKDYVDFLRDQAIDNGFPDDCIERTMGFPLMSRGELLHDMWSTYGRSAPVNVGSSSKVADTDLDGDGFAPPADCDDSDNTVFPGAPELCDARDNDCDGNTDEGNPGGGGNCSTGLLGICEAGTEICQGGALTCVANSAPGTEVCDGLDNDCDGGVDEGNPGGGAACSTGLAGVCASGTLQCMGGSVQCVPGAGSIEVCDGLDNDCDGSIDEDNPQGGAACSTGQPGVCDDGTQVCQGGSLVCQSIPSGSVEICGNGLDDDCDGSTDETDDCELCSPVDVISLAVQTKKNMFKLSSSPGRDKLVARGAFVMPDPQASSPDSEVVTLSISDEAGTYYEGTIPAGSFVAGVGDKKYRYKDKSPPLENDGIKQGKFSRKRDQKTLRYSFKAQELDHPPFTGAASTVTIRIGGTCYVDSSDVCTTSPSGTSIKCR